MKTIDEIIKGIFSDETGFDDIVDFNEGFVERSDIEKAMKDYALEVINEIADNPIRYINGIEKLKKQIENE